MPNRRFRRRPCATRSATAACEWIGPMVGYAHRAVSIGRGAHGRPGARIRRSGSASEWGVGCCAATSVPTAITEATSFSAVIFQIMVIDVVFSLDSIITAVGMVAELSIMVAAIVAAVVFMFAFAGTVHGFVDRHPTIKMLALAFLLVIGLALIADGCDVHIPKGYIYSAMAFSIGVEILNIRLRRRGQPVHLHGPDVQPTPVCPTCGQPVVRP
ncbi:MAG: TerC family protein [Nitrospira sp.]|nr:TerC family protein [Nitrospira sp.]